MLKAVRQIRSAISMLNPEGVRRLTARPVHVGLVAGAPSAYAEMEDFLVPASVSHERRIELTECLHRASDNDDSHQPDLVLFDASLSCPKNCYVFDRRDPGRVVGEILREREDMSLPLARMFPPFRKPVVDGIIHSVSRENAMFALATALPNIVPSLIELPWAIGEFASDTAFLTMNQIRMAFMIAAACGAPVGFAQQKTEIASILAAAFGWRTLARELAGKLPLGSGLIPKGAIAFAGTFAIGKGLDHLHRVGRNHTAAERRAVYRHALEQGKDLARGALEAGE